MQGGRAWEFMPSVACAEYAVSQGTRSLLYFQTGAKIVCACNEPEFGRLSWPRLQKGCALLEKQYGVSLANLNRLALMATKSKDSVVAGSAFKRIGDSWDKEAGTTDVYFIQNKTWAAQIAPAEARSRRILQEAAANLQSEGGAQYQKNMEQAMLPLMRQCAQSSNDDQGKFELVVRWGKTAVRKTRGRAIPLRWPCAYSESGTNHISRKKRLFHRRLIQLIGSTFNWIRRPLTPRRQTSSTASKGALRPRQVPILAWLLYRLSAFPRISASLPVWVFTASRMRK